jgi:hypothetical protein
MKPHKHAELIKAWADGHEIQELHCGYWFDITVIPWEEDRLYRIRPKDPVVRWLWAYQSNGSWYQSDIYLSDKEVISYFDAHFPIIKLEYTRMEFPE